MKKSLLRVATLESGIITTTPATREFFARNGEFHISIVKNDAGERFAIFTGTSTGEQLRTSPLTNDIEELCQQWQGRYARITTANSTINIWFDRTKIKEMEYKPERVCSVLCEGERKGYKFVIVSYGTHPCVYISGPTIEQLTSYDDFYEVDCHGGATYLGDLTHVDESKTDKYVGWDYAHGSDYIGGMGYEEIAKKLGIEMSFKKWTTEEILSEVYDVIDEITK